ncbi:helix-turn-helix domain-containing protein [Streptomyces sp. NPDC048441]|uniref:helix-turn-helix domain-containing protein n=1 Tax=Streptomyces sp. NPDC048441 TaxID=3365552 RepID=UPI003716F087
MEDRPPTTFQVDGAAIRTRRNDLGMTQAMCANAASISRSYLAEIEAGHRWRMRPPAYAGLRTALQIQVDDALADRLRAVAPASVVSLPAQCREGGAVRAARRQSWDDEDARALVRAELSAACCERWWTSAGAAHEDTCRTNDHRSAA